MATIFGTVYDSGSTVLTGATVSLPGHSVFNSNGSYYVIVGAGTFTLTASCPNYNPSGVQVSVSSTQTKSQDFHLSHV